MTIKIFRMSLLLEKQINMDRYLTITWQKQIQRPDWDAIKDEDWASPVIQYMETKQGSLVGQCLDHSLLSPIVDGQPKRDGYTIFEILCPVEWDGDRVFFNGQDVGLMQMTHVPPGGFLPFYDVPSAGDGFNVIVGHILVPTGDDWIEKIFADLGSTTFPGRKDVSSTKPVAEGFQVKMAKMPDAAFYPLGIKPGMPAVAIRHPSGPWTTAKYSSIDAMSRLKTFGAYEVSGVTIQLCNTIVRGTTKSSSGLEKWEKPALAYSGSAPVTECERHEGRDGKVAYLLPIPSDAPDEPKPVKPGCGTTGTSRG